MQKTKVALLGAGFIGDIHLESYRRFVPEAEVTCIYSGTAQRAEEFAKKHHIPRWFADIDEFAAIKDGDFEVIDIGLPNFVHAKIAEAAARAGKHVIVEKPLSVTLEEADSMIEACRANRVKLMYAEQLCFAPKYERVRELIREGAIGTPYLIKQSEKHSGPHSDWFWTIWIAREEASSWIWDATRSGWFLLDAWKTCWPSQSIRHHGHRTPQGDARAAKTRRS